MADNSEVRSQVKKELRRAARDKFLDMIKPPTSAFKNATEELLHSPNLTPQQREEYEQLQKGIKLYEWNRDALQRGMRMTAKDEYKPEFVDENVRKYNNLTPTQIEAEYSGAFDEAADRFNGIRPLDFNHLNDSLRERLDANAGIRGERLDRGKGGRLDKNMRSNNINRPTAPRMNDLIPDTLRGIARALLRARQKRQSHGGPR